MIKRIAYILVIVCCIIVTVGFFRYNPTVIYTEKVPTSAETVIYVNLREIEYNILLSFLKHPLSQFDSKKSSTTKEEEKITLLDQVEIPNSVFFYTNQQEFKDFLISNQVPIKAKFAEALKEEGFTEQKIRNAFVYTKGRVSCVVQNNSLQILFKKYQKAVVSSELLSALNHKDYFSEEDLIFKQIKNSETPIAINTLQGDFFKLIIDEGVLRIQGELSEENDLFKSFKATSIVSSMLSISGKLNTKIVADRLDKDFKDKFKKLTTLSLDSVISKWDGVVEGNLTSFIEKSDTIVTYEYDDDFNKIEKKEVQKTITPKVILEVEGGDLCSYLEEKKAIQKVDNEDLLTLMPLFTTYSFCEESGLRFTSVKNQKLVKKANKNSKFYFLFNVADYQQKDRGIYSFKNKYLDKVKTIQLSVTNNNQLEASVEFKNTSKNFFLQVLN
ncbi:hypothetical protein C7448_10157 [Tenacibaculum gallaicum]|uniref:DUF4836 family protein n=1 Tax=Tenacibaculum gallaicum TaxID=561505 RepID=A0A3E0IBG9_9FLAO|nr:hypothetical protein [Tenacibaculum gallaicum]REH56029.1 hypothetical protein C7448_10157 [Tenacibaculum gallaicum]